MWGEIRAAFEAVLGLKHDQDGWLGVVIEGALVRVEAVTVRGEPWVLLLGMVCNEDDLPHRTALALNLELPVGALALNGDRYELRLALPLAGHAPGDVLEGAVDVAREACRLARELAARRRGALIFSTFAE